MASRKINSIFRLYIKRQIKHFTTKLCLIFLNAFLKSIKGGNLQFWISNVFQTNLCPIITCRNMGGVSRFTNSIWNKKIQSLHGSAWLWTQLCRGRVTGTCRWWPCRGQSGKSIEVKFCFPPLHLHCDESKQTNFYESRKGENKEQIIFGNHNSYE